MTCSNNHDSFERLHRRRALGTVHPRGPGRRGRIPGRWPDVRPVELVLRDTDGAPWARTVLDAGTSENSLVLAAVHQRGERWRLRVIGQGYEEPLAGFAIRHGA